MKKEEKTEITKNKIYAAAMSEFGTRGYANGSINNICKTGINKGLIYHNFKDKDTLYLECVKKSCEKLIQYITGTMTEDTFVEYMNARMKFFREYEPEAYIFLEALTNPPRNLVNQIHEIFSEFDIFNLQICEKELSRHELRDSISKEDALHYFSIIQKISNLSFVNQINGNMSPQEQFAIHELNVHKMFDLMLYGIAKRRNEK